MAIMYGSTPFDIVNDEEELTEQEHIDSCDINKMIKAVSRGQEVRGNSHQPIYGYDDTNLTGLQHHINRAETEEELRSIAETHEFSEEEIQHIDPSVAKKFGFKTKAKQQPQQTTIQTTKNVDDKMPKEPTPEEKTPKS